MKKNKKIGHGHYSLAVPPPLPLLLPRGEEPSCHRLRQSTSVRLLHLSGRREWKTPSLRSSEGQSIIHTLPTEHAPPPLLPQTSAHCSCGRMGTLLECSSGSSCQLSIIAQNRHADSVCCKWMLRNSVLVLRDASPLTAYPDSKD